MNYKTCTKCGDKLEATLEFFYKSKTGKFGLFAKCKTCCKKYNQKYWKNNKERHAVINKRYRKNNKEKNAAALKKWKKNNLDKVSIYFAKHRALKLNQTPCLTKAENQQIRAIYKKSQELGLNWHVDHVQPLSKGGLHHPNNLQIVRKKYNLQKGSKLNFRLPDNNEIFKL